MTEEEAHEAQRRLGPEAADGAPSAVTGGWRERRRGENQEAAVWRNGEEKFVSDNVEFGAVSTF